MTTANADPITTVTIEERAAAHLSNLTTRRAERIDELDLPRTMTQREVNAYVAETVSLDRRIASLRAGIEALAAVPSTDGDEAWLAQLNAWRPALCDKLEAI